MLIIALITISSFFMISINTLNPNTTMGVSVKKTIFFSRLTNITFVIYKICYFIYYSVILFTINYCQCSHHLYNIFCSYEYIVGRRCPSPGFRPSIREDFRTTVLFIVPTGRIIIIIFAWLPMHKIITRPESILGYVIRH